MSHEQMRKIAEKPILNELIRPYGQDYVQTERHGVRIRADKMDVLNIARRVL